MSAEVESLMYVGREKPWHGLGVSVEEAPNSKEAIKLAGLDWEVESKPVYTNGNVIPGYKANVRNADGAVLDIVTDRYQIVQNKDAFDFTDALIGTGDVKYETAGSLLGGKRVFLLARMPEKEILGDKIEPYICFSNGFNRAYSIKACCTDVRVVCNNTLNFALSNAQRSWSTKHIGDMQSKLEEAKRSLNLANEYFDKLSETAEKLVEVKISDEEQLDILDKVINTGEVKSDRQKQNIEEQKNSFYVCMLAPDILKFRNTGWGFLNATTDYFQHRSPKRITQNYKERNFNSIIDGNIYVDKMFMEMLDRMKVAV